MPSKLAEWWRYRRVRRANHRANRAGRGAKPYEIQHRARENRTVGSHPHSGATQDGGVGGGGTGRLVQ
jgi:hypothetical protein